MVWDLIYDPHMNTQAWYTVLAIILIALFGTQILADRGVIENPKPVLAIGLIAFATWVAGYAALSLRRGIIDFFGPAPYFTRARRPVVFFLVILFMSAIAIATGWAGVHALR
jgi:hypothetical protein